MGLIAGAAYEYDATLGVTGSSPVTAWADQSGNGRDLGPESGSPTLSVGGANGLNAITFNGAGLWRNTVVVTVPRTFYLILKSAVSTSSVFKKAIDHGGGAVGVGGSGHDAQYHLGTTPGDVAGGTIDTNWHGVVYVVNAASSLIEVDGVQVATGDLTGTASTSYVEIGGDGASQTWNGLIAFAAVRQAADNAALRNANILLPMTKFGLYVAQNQIVVPRIASQYAGR